MKSMIDVIKSAALIRGALKEDIDAKDAQFRKALADADEALQKQIPMKCHTKVNDSDTAINGHVIFRKGARVHYCPACHAPVTPERFCGKCGQALIW